MADMISTIILKVDLDCHQCYKKIRKILCKLQDQERIRTISYDGKSNTVAIAGPFDALKLTCKIRCHAGKVVKDVHIINAGGGQPPNIADHAPPPQPPPQSAMSKGKKKKKSNKKKHCEEDKHNDDPAPPPPAAEPSPPPRPPSPPPPAENHPPPSPPPQMTSATMPPSTYEEKKPREWPAELEPPPPMEQPPPMEKGRPMPIPIQMRERPSPVAKPFYPVEVWPTVEIPSWPAAMPPPCSCGCYQGYYEGCRCGSCGRVYGYSVAAAPSAGCYGNGGGATPYCGGYSGCRVVNEEDPTAACSVM